MRGICGKTQGDVTSQMWGAGLCSIVELCECMHALPLNEMHVI